MNEIDIPTAKLDAAQLVRIEAAALEALAARLDGPMAADFDRAVELVLKCGENRGRVVVTGMGKSGIIAQKIAATLSSTGTPALFLHPGEAVHGDIGGLAAGDVVIALSASGETEEILRLLVTLKRVGDALISFCCNLQFDPRPGERCCARLLGLARGLRSWIGADRLDHRYARAWRCAGDSQFRSARAFGPRISPTCIREAGLAASWRGSAS